MLRQLLFEVATDLFTIETMTISHRKEVGILESAEVRHGDPGILVYLVWVAGRETCLGGECKFGHCIGVHLLWVTAVI